MTAINPINAQALILINRARQWLTAQQYRTLRGQVLAGDSNGALRGLKKLINMKKETRP